MIIKSPLAMLGVFVLLSAASPAHALDQLPLPEAGVTSAQAEVLEFASANTHPAAIDTCSRLLKAEAARPDNEKIRAIKAYRQCRAEQALQQLSVWRWQGNTN